MIDFIKIQLNDISLIDKICESELLRHKKQIKSPNNKTGESFITIYYEYRRLCFAAQVTEQYKPTQMYVYGSLHYYFNKGLHNANDFSFANFQNVLQDLNDKFELAPEKCLIKSLEFGVNVNIQELDATKIVQNLFYYQRKKFVEPINKPYKQAGNLRSNDHILKVYNKSFQFPKETDGEVIRFELKYGRMRPLNKIGINLLSDLLLKENHLKLYKNLIKSISQILLYDYTVNTAKLTPTKKKNVLNYSNPNYWHNILIDIRKRKLDRKNFDYHKKRLNNIINLNSKNILKNIIQLIEYKKIILLNLSDSELTRFKKAYPKYTYLINNKCTPCTQLYIGCISPSSFHNNHVLSKQPQITTASKFNHSNSKLNDETFVIIVPCIEENEETTFEMIVPYVENKNIANDVNHLAQQFTNPSKRLNNII